MAQVGEIFGNYRLLEELASGSFGSVYRGVHTVLTTRIVAVKIMHMHLRTKQSLKPVMQHPMRLLTLLSSATLCKQG